MTYASTPVDRRRVLLGTAALAAGAMTGCGREDEPQVAPISERQDVPLRLLLVGSQSGADAISRGWRAVTEQPLSIQVIQLQRDKVAAVSGQVLDAATKNDLLIYPLALVAELDASDAITSLSDEDFSEIESKTGNLFPALRSGAARYSGKYIGMPLGASLPALVSSTELPEEFDEQPLGWQRYDDLVQEHWQGEAAEPTAPGWAGAMYLWRAASNTGWLFNRESFEPRIDTEPYVDALQQMMATHAKYAAKEQTPGEIWAAIGAGKLKGGIAFPELRTSVGTGQLLIREMPGVEEISRVLLDPFSPILSLSSNCRQTATAKRFLRWISGTEGSETVRNQVAGMTPTSVRVGITGDRGTASGGAAEYDRWLARRLATPVTLPTLQIRHGGEYYEVLDHQVTRALRGDVDASTALSEAAERWREKTSQIGADKQLRAWRRAQGMRG